MPMEMPFCLPYVLERQMMTCYSDTSLHSSCRSIRLWGSQGIEHIHYRVSLSEGCMYLHTALLKVYHAQETMVKRSQKMEKRVKKCCHCNLGYGKVENFKLLIPKNSFTQTYLLPTIEVKCFWNVQAGRQPIFFLRLLTLPVIVIGHVR